jgi:hypothetical protein
MKQSGGLVNRKAGRSLLFEAAFYAVEAFIVTGKNTADVIDI